MQTAHLYDVTVNWNSDRKGTLSSLKLPTNIEVATPPEFPKGIEGIWSPEHYFVAAVNSCLMTTFLSIAENSKLEFQSFTSTGIGKLEIVDGKYMMSEVTLNPVVTIKDESMKEKAERVLVKSEANCLISNSIKSTIIFKPIIKFA
jgi:peroxiredoxin-like protein